MDNWLLQPVKRWMAAWLFLGVAWGSAGAAVVELNSSGGTTATNGLHVYIGDDSRMQVLRLNAGQVYDNVRVPPHARLDNGIFLRANGTLYGPSFALTTVSFSPTAYSSTSISGPTPANPVANGVLQTAVATYGIAGGPQLSVTYRYLRPYDFVTLAVTLTIPTGYPVSTSNPVRYYHAFDTYLGGSDTGCGVTLTDSNGHRVVGTYPGMSSGVSCPSSSAVPSSVSIIESFRERSGPAFSKYCTALWSDFWDNTSPYSNCALRNASGLASTVTTSLVDTGVGVEYDFTAAGTYTFEYDFVIGSPAVPAYDHVELRYTPGTNLCPMDVTILGCTSSTVPCPAGSELNANLTGTVSASGGGGATWSPSANFSIAAGTPTTTLSMTPAAPGGTLTLGASGMSSTPLNGVKCWNGTSASCSLTLPNVGCFASDLDACSNLIGSPARCGPTGNRLYTKVAGQAMSFDLVALKGSPKVVDTSFNSGAGNPVSVDLVSSTATAVGANRCPTTAPTAVSGVAAQTVTFTAGRPAAATTYTVPAAQNTNAYRNVWVRFNQGAGGTFCSNDRFAIRPAAFTAVSSGDADADVSGASATATPVVKAGAAFTLTADTGTPGYDGTPGVAPSLIEWLAMPVQIGTLAGSFTTAAVAASGNGASGAAFTYDEVGYFRFQPQGVYDATFTSAYQDASDTVCVNTPPDDFANTPNGAGKVGCKFGNTSASGYFGRFIPDHFDTSVVQACATGSFTYSGQPFSVTVTARNAAGGTTRNYHGTGAPFAKATTLSARDAGDTAADPGPGALTAAGVAAATFSNGAATTAAPVYTFTAATTGPTVVRVRATDAEGVSSLRPAPATTVEGSTTIRSGRLWLANAYGNEFLPLAMPIEVQYWLAGSWRRNKDDSSLSCTKLVLPVSGSGLLFAAQGPRNQLAAGETTAISAWVTGSNVYLNQGSPEVKLTAPGVGNYGYVDIIGSALRGANNWLLLAVPSARACFGTCGPRSSVIYSRERY